MLILLTNDDGIRAPGIAAMYRELTRLGTVHVVAPETVQSATSHGITIDQPLLVNEVSVEGVFKGYSVEGRPADCVKLAIDKLLPRRPDLVVSGVNAGCNVGINVLYSGTVAAAIEAAFLGLPSVATSLLLSRDVETNFNRSAEWTRVTIETLLAKKLIQSGTVANINIPALKPGQDPRGTKFVRQCCRPYVDSYELRQSPKGQKYFWNSSVFTLLESEDDTDVAALRDGYITVTPLHFDLTHRAMLPVWQR